MGWLKKLFSAHKEFVGDFIETGEALTTLAASNQIVATEVDQFAAKAKAGPKEIAVLAERSANALSGYGISVSPKAFLELLGH